VDDLEVVFNFDLPNDAEDYTHRIGRTGRAGRTGMAFTFVSGRELYKLQQMVHYGRLKIRRENIPSLDEVEEARGHQFYQKLRATLTAKQFKPQDGLIGRLLEEGHTSTDIAAALIHLLQGQESETKAKLGHAGSQAIPSQLDVAKSSARAAQEKPVRRGFERRPRTGREPGFTTVSFNVGRQHLVTPADLVGKIAGVTRLPANVVGAIDIHEDHALVDVEAGHAELVLAKLAGIRLKNQSLKLAIVPPVGE
jgi:ATP-dependent RNA helicase DeaD